MPTEQEIENCKELIKEGIDEDLEDLEDQIKKLNEALEGFNQTCDKFLRSVKW